MSMRFVTICIFMLCICVYIAFYPLYLIYSFQVKAMETKMSDTDLRTGMYM